MVEDSGLTCFPDKANEMAVKLGRRIGRIDLMPMNEAIAAREILIGNLMVMAAGLGIYEKVFLDTNMFINKSTSLNDDEFDGMLCEVMANFFPENLL